MITQGARCAAATSAGRGHHSPTAGGEVEDATTGHQQVHPGDVGQPDLGSGDQSAAEGENGPAEATAGTGSMNRRLLGRHQLREALQRGVRGQQRGRVLARRPAAPGRDPAQTQQQGISLGCRNDADQLDIAEQISCGVEVD